MRERGSKQERETRRFRAVALLTEGCGVCKVSELLGVTSGAVSQWKAAYAARGEAGLLSKKHPGAKPKLPPEKRQKLPSLLLEGPRAHGFQTDLWTLERVADVIEKKFDVAYHPAHVWRILDGLGWSAQKPERLARERNEQAIAQWRRSAWPDIKKSPQKRP